MARGKSKKKYKKATAAVIKDVSPLLAVSDFSDFQDFAFEDSGQEDSSKEIDSDTENAIYAQMYFNTSSDLASNLFDQGSKVAVVGGKKGSTDDDDVHKGSVCLPEFETPDDIRQLSTSTPDVIDISLDRQLSVRESSLSQSPAKEILEISFKKDTTDDIEKKKKKRKRKKRKVTSAIIDDDDATDKSENTFRREGIPHTSHNDEENEVTAGSSEACLDIQLVGSEEPYIIIEDDERPSTSPNSSSPEADIRYMFDSAKKSSKHKHGKTKYSVSSPDHDDRSSLEQGEITTSGNSSPTTRRAESADMDLCSTGDDGAEGDDADPWKISEKDKLGRDAYDRLHGYDDNAGRYYGQRNGAKCRNCKQKGHVILKCPWPKRPTVCYLCAKTGHVSSNCPQRLCSYCYMRKHRGRPCSVLYNLGTQCVRCRMSGHQASVCPDQWRQYHHTLYGHAVVVDEGFGTKRTDKRNIYCSNCSRKGHFGYECTIPVARGVPRHHLPLIAYHDTRMWPPSDARSNHVILQALRTRPPPQPHYFPPEINFPMTTPGNRPDFNPAHMPQSVEALGQKRTLEEASDATTSGMGQLRDEEAHPPPQKRRKNRNKNRRSSHQSAENDSSMSNDMEAISSDEFDDGDSRNPVASDKSKYKGRDRGSSHDPLINQGVTRPQYLDTHHRSELVTRGQYDDTYMNHSLSHSPFANMHGRQVQSHSSGSPSSSAIPINDRLFPRTPHNYRESPVLSRQDSQQHDYRRKSFNEHQRPSPLNHRHSMDYSSSDSPHWMDSPHEKRLPLLMSPPQTPPLSPRSPLFPDTVSPSRSHSSGFRQPQPPPMYPRRFSEPASHRNQPGSNDSTPASRRDHHHHHHHHRDGQYTTSDRGFRIPSHRAAQIKYDHRRRYSSEYDRF